jgi:hypothetical protein
MAVGKVVGSIRVHRHQEAHSDRDL